MSDGAEPQVHLERHGHVAVLTLSAGKANTYSYELMQLLDARVLECRMDDEVQVIVLRGAGDRFFCAGADIGQLQEMTERRKYFFCLHANETLLRLEHTPKLVIAAIQGHCVGGGLEVALACDLRWGRSGKYLVGLPEVALGVLPGTGGTQRLIRLLGKARALELMTAGTTFGPAEAKEQGLLSEVFEQEDESAFMDAVLERAAEFASPKRAAFAVGAIKRACQSGAEMGLEQGLALERELQARLFASADAKEGLAAHLERRDADFAGQ